MELRISSTFQHVTWKIRDFLQLPRESGSFLDSPDFLFHGDKYCVRLYPEVKSEEGNETQFHVRKLSTNSVEGKVCCEIGLWKRERDGDEWYDYDSRMSLEENRVYSRSSIEQDRDEYVPDGSLTVVCDMWLRSGAGSSAPGEEEQGGLPEHNASCSTRWSSPKMELATDSPCTVVGLTVDDFLSLPREEVDSLASREFLFAGDTFRVRFCRNADTGDAELRLLRVTSTFTQRTVRYRVGCWDMDCPRYPRSSRSLVGTSGFCLSLSEIREQRDKYVDDATLDVALFLHLGEESGTPDTARERGGLTGLHKLQSDYGQLLKGTESDACVVVRGKEFRVHRNVLRARSTVFEAMFGHDTAEKESARVVVDDLDPDCFGPFLEYLYTGEVGAGLSDDNALGVYVAAKKYDVATLKSECVDHMRRNMSVHTFCDVVTLALRYLEEGLLEQAICFFKDNMQDIIVTPKWIQFMFENPISGNELFIKAIVPGK